MPHQYLITGATGFAGSHLAEACAARDIPVRTIARPGSDTSFLEKLGVTIVRGDITDPEVVRRAVDGADVVVNFAAKVGDWGPVEEYRAVNVEALRSLLDICRARPLHRFVQISSLGVYEARHHYGTDETTPLPVRHIDGYTQTKAEADRLALSYHRDHGLPVVVLRPGFIYGPRDHTILPPLIDNLRKRKVRYLGNGRRAVNSIFVRNLVEAVFLAVERPHVVGQAFNLTDGEFVSKRRLIEAVATGLGLPKPPPIWVPLWFARILTAGIEGLARLRGATRAPFLTQGRLKFLGLNLDFSIAKARRELGYGPRIPFDQGIEETLAWYRQEGYGAPEQAEKRAVAH